MTHLNQNELPLYTPCLVFFQSPLSVLFFSLGLPFQPYCTQGSSFLLARSAVFFPPRQICSHGGSDGLGRLDPHFGRTAAVVVRSEEGGQGAAWSRLASILVSPLRWVFVCRSGCRDCPPSLDRRLVRNEFLCRRNGVLSTFPG